MARSTQRVSHFAPNRRNMFHALKLAGAPPGVEGMMPAGGSAA